MKLERNALEFVRFLWNDVENGDEQKIFPIKIHEKSFRRGELGLCPWCIYNLTSQLTDQFMSIYFR